MQGPSFNNLAMQLRHCCNHPFLIKGVVQSEGLHLADDATYLARFAADELRPRPAPKPPRHREPWASWLAGR